MYHTGPQPSTDAWISNVAQLVCGFGFILGQLPEREHSVVVPRHRVQHFHVLLSSLQRASLSGRYKRLSPSLCPDNSLPRRCTFDFQIESSHRAHPERNCINMALKAGTSQTWPVAVLIQPTTTSPAAGPPASSWCFKPSANSLLSPPQLTFPAFTPNAMYIALPGK